MTDAGDAILGDSGEPSSGVGGMTEPQPYTGTDIMSMATALSREEGDGPRLAATLRAYRRVLAENEKLQAEVAALREDARRWRAVREDLAVERESAIVGGVECQYWRFVGNNYDLYPGPFPATLDEAADRLIAAAIEDQKFIDAAREGGEGEANNVPR